MTIHIFGRDISESTRGIAEKYRFRPKDEGLSDIEEYDTCEKNLLSKMGEGKDRKDFAWQMDLDMEALCINANKIDEIRSELCEFSLELIKHCEGMFEFEDPEYSHAWQVACLKGIIAKFGAQHLIVPDEEEDKDDPQVLVVEEA
jgi:hypothetical protein